MTKSRRRFALFLRTTLILAPLSGLCVPVAARQVDDMAARRVDIPDQVRKVYATTHALPLMTAIAPELLAGLAFPVPPGPETLAALPPVMAGLPNLGGGPRVDPARLEAAGVDLIVGGVPAGTTIPAVSLQVDRADQAPASLRYLGHLLGRDQRGEILAAAVEQALTRLHDAVGQVPAATRTRVYYAESADGLTSQCDGADRAEVIALAGAVNVVGCGKAGGPPSVGKAGGSPSVGKADGPPSVGKADGGTTLDLDRLVALDPDVIVTRFAPTVRMMAEDPAWRRLRAVTTGRVYAAPTLPFNWFDRPPSFLRVLGARWLAAVIRPPADTDAVKAEIRDFLTLFFGVAPRAAQLDALFPPSR